MKKLISGFLAVLMVSGLVLSGCGNTEKAAESTTGSASASSGTAAQTGGSFIADRTIKIKHYQVGITLPEDQVNNKVFKKIKELTGVQVQLDVMKGQDIIQDLSIDLASGELPDVMTGYCEGTNNSANANVVNLLVKTAKDDLFYDMKSALQNTVNYKKFLDENYLTKDAKENIIMRKDFNGAIYLLQMEIPRPDVPSAVWVGGAGLYIRNDIATALGVDPSTIKTNEDLYELAKKIKAGNFKDGNGKPITTAIGPTIWGGSKDPAYAAQEFDFGNSSTFDYDSDGKVKNVMLTDYPYKAVQQERKLIAEGLMAKETFSLQGQQATEAFANAQYPIMYMHPFSQSWDGGSDVLRSKNKDKMYIPIGPMQNYKGSTEKVAVRRGNTFVAISKAAEKPEEILKFLDWCSTTEGNRLINNGFENEDYTLQDRVSKEYLKYTKDDPSDDGKDPVPTPEYTEKAAQDASYKTNQGIGVPPLTYLSNVDMYKDLAASYGLGAPDQFPFEYGRKVLKLAAPEVKVIDGLPASGVLENFTGIKQLKPVLDIYGDTIVKAIYAKSDEEAVKILDAYKKQLIDAGVEEAAKYLQDVDSKNPGSVIFYLTN